MPNNHSPAVRDVPPLDPRVLRSTRALGAALVELMLEEHFEDITVQRILDRAGVGRATFYAHFRNKHDVLHSSYEWLFNWLESRLDETSSRQPRVAPVAEFLTHVADMGPLMNALETSGQLDEMMELATGYFAAMMERCITARPGGTAVMAAPLLARMLAAALVEMTRWWLGRQSRPAPAEMDATFQRLALTMVAQAGFIRKQGVARSDA